MLRQRVVRHGQWMRSLVVAVSVVMALVCCAPHVALSGCANVWTPGNAGIEGTDATCITRGEGGKLYLGTDSEGVYESADGGLSWRWIGSGLPKTLEPLVSTYLHVNVLSSWRRGGVSGLLCGTNAGLFWFDGTQWVPEAAVLKEQHIRCLLVDGSAAGSLIAGTDDGVWKSDDGGVTWIAHNASMRAISVNSVVLDRDNNGVCFAATNSGVYRSPDQGNTWIRLSQLSAVVNCVAQVPRHSQTMLIGTTRGIFRSFDSGVTWTLMTPVSLPINVIALHVDEFDSMWMQALTTAGLTVSHDGGETWTWLVGPVDHVLYHAGLIEVTGDRVRALTAAQDGLRILDGTTSTLVTRGLGLLEVTAVAGDWRTGQSYAVRRTGLYRRGEGTDWSLVNASLGAAGVISIAVDGVQPRVLYAATALGIMRSIDSGTSWSAIPQDLPAPVVSICCNPNIGDVVFAATNLGLWKRQAGPSATWQDVGPKSGYAYVSVASSAEQGGPLFVADASTVWRSLDGGSSWQVTGTWPAALSGSLVVGPGPSFRLYAVSGRTALSSDDAGTTWQQLGIPVATSAVHSLALVPPARTQVLLGTDDGIFLQARLQDDVAPMLSISSPIDGSSAHSSSVTVQGRATDDLSGVRLVTVAGSSVQIDPGTGVFSTAWHLATGDNTIHVSATDYAGNATDIALHVTYVLPITVLTLQIGSGKMSRSNGPDVNLDAAPAIMRSRTFLPIRAVAEALGGTVGWDAGTRTATVSLGGHQVSLQIGSSIAIVDGVRRPIDSADALVVPVILSGRTLLPVRFVAESLGCTVGWDSTTKQITITYEGT